MDDPNHPILFPSTGPNPVSDDDLRAAADGIKQVINFVDPSFSLLNVPFEDVDHTSAARRRQEGERNNIRVSRRVRGCFLSIFPATYFSY